MDCQNYMYSRLDSSESEGCQKMDKVSDLRIQIDSEKPLLEPVKQVSGVKTVKKIKKAKRVLSTLDIFISVFIVTPCVVGCWRGVWQLMDIYAVYFPAWESFFIGMATHVVLALGQDVFHSVVVEKKTKSCITKVFSLFLMKFYVTTFNVVTNLIWRGGWLIFDRYCRVELTPTGAATMESSTNALWFTVVCTLVLFSLKGVKNTMSPPFSVALDSKDEVFLFRTTYIYKMGGRTSLYLLDCLFSILIVGTLVVFVWRGAWIMMDIFVFPEDDTLSAWASLILGYASVAVAFLMQPVMKYLCDRFNGAPRLLLADLFILFALFGTVNVWRGIWNLLNIYFLPESPELSCWITHWVCLIVLILLGCANSLLVRGVYIDAEEPAGKCVVFPCYYLRVIFQGEKLRQLNLTSLNFDHIRVHKRDVDKVVENNHTVTVSTVSYIVAENHKEDC